MIRLILNARISLTFVFILLQLPASIIAQNNPVPFGLYFSIDHQDSLQLYSDEPATLTVSVSNPALAFANNWNKEARSYLEELKQQLKDGDISEEAYEKEQKLVTDGMMKSSESKIGSFSSPWASKVLFKVNNLSGKEVAIISLQLSNGSRPDAVAVLDEGSHHSAVYNLPSNTLTALSSGTYRIVASIEDIESAPVQLQYQSNAIPDRVRNATPMQLKLGRYYLQEEDPIKAKEFAQRILKREPNSLDALVLRADSQLLSKNYKVALADYQKALDLFYIEFPDSYEAPEYLLDMIEHTLQKIESFSLQDSSVYFTQESHN